MKILITGISGTLARGVAYRLVRRGHQVVGIDRRPWPDVPEGVEMHQADIRKRPAEDVFRLSQPDALIHMATVTHFTTSTEERYRINLGGTRKLFEYCHEYGVKQAVFVGRHTVYGATPDSPLYHTEDEPPLAGAAFKELADLVAADLYAGSALWRWPELNTAVLRLCYFLGPSRGGTLAGFLSKSRVPMVRTDANPDRHVAQLQAAQRMHAQRVFDLKPLHRFADDALSLFHPEALVGLVLQLLHVATIVVIAYPTLETDIATAGLIAQRRHVVARRHRAANETKRAHPPATGGMNTTESPSARPVCQSPNSSLTATLSWPMAGNSWRPSSSA